jgi:hypothetical protein
MREEKFKLSDIKELKTENLSHSDICKRDNMQTEYEKNSDE